MAFKIYCDGCGVEVKEEMHTTVIVNPHDDYPYDKYDFCEKCIWEVRRSLALICSGKKDEKRG